MKTFTEDQVYDMYDNMLDNSEEPVTIAGVTFDPHRVLKKLDPTAYETGFNDFLDMEELVYIDSSTLAYKDDLE